MALPRLASLPTGNLGFALAAELGSGSTSTAFIAASAAAAAVSLPFIAVHVRPSGWTVHADALLPSCSAATAVLSRRAVVAASVAESKQAMTDWWAEAKSLLSVFHPRRVLLTFAKHTLIQSLLKFNHYMMMLLDYEERKAEAEEQGQQVPDPPPIPDFKPGFTKALENSVREVSVTLVRKVYEIAAVRRLGIVRAEPFLRDYKNWIRDVLAFKYRLDPALVRYTKYTFAVLHGAALFYAAECTVATIQLIYSTRKRADKTHAQKALTIARGTAAQFVGCSIRFGTTAVGVGLFSLLKPGLGTALGSAICDLGATVATAPLVAVITGM